MQNKRLLFFLCTLLASHTLAFGSSPAKGKKAAEIASLIPIATDEKLDGLEKTNASKSYLEREVAHIKDPVLQRQMRRLIVNHPDKNGFTPLHHAAGRRELRYIDYLLNQGADPRIRSNISFLVESETPAETARKYASMDYTTGADAVHFNAIIDRLTRAEKGAADKEKQEQDEKEQLRKERAEKWAADKEKHEQAEKFRKERERLGAEKDRKLIERVRSSLGSGTRETASNPAHRRTSALTVLPRASVHALPTQPAACPAGAGE